MLGDILIEYGWLTADMLSTTLALQEEQQRKALNAPLPQRIGEYLVVEGMISQAQLVTALAHQAQLAQSGQHMMLGEILIHSGFLAAATLDQVLEQQRQNLIRRFEEYHV